MHIKKLKALMKKFTKLITSRIFLVSYLILIQVLIILFLVLFLSSVFVPVLILFLILEFVFVLAIIDRNANPMFKVAWIIPILVFPVGGVLFYLLFGRTHLNKKNTAKLKAVIDSTEGIIVPNEYVLNELGKRNGHIKREATYFIKNAQTNVYAHTATEYYPTGTVFFDSLLVELKKAEHFIFIEYFIIEEGRMWNAVLDILKEKLEKGVEIRLMYDDVGSINTLKMDFPAKMRALGIAVSVFNPYKPSVDKFLNYRDHRKFTIIDGKVAFTGGINIADEYINEKERFGYWADSSVKLDGDAVNKITILFLQMWYFSTGDLPQYLKYMVDYKNEYDGLIIPYSDEPLFQELICENGYINVINNAKDYVYICTPYLILDNVMESALISAARSGVNVTIITPHIPDKKTVFLMTRSNYKDLIDGGVNIYEFTPGFMHTKAIVSDDRTAIVGTSNFDYRSFYLHFENGIWMHHSKAVLQCKEAFEAFLQSSEKITPEFCNDIHAHTRLLRSILKIFAPLL